VRSFSRAATKRKDLARASKRPSGAGVTPPSIAAPGTENVKWSIRYLWTTDRRWRRGK